MDIDAVTNFLATINPADASINLYISNNPPSHVINRLIMFH